MVESVTGRDASVVCKALAYAIHTIESLPFEYRENSDMADMKTLLEHYAASNYGVGYYMENARSHMEQSSFDPARAGIKVFDRTGGNVVSMLDHLRNEIKGK